MKNRAGKLAALVMALVLGVTALTGCLEVNGERVAVVIGKNKYAVSEAQIYFYYQQYLTEVSISSLVGSLLGSYETYWAMSSDGYSSVESCRDEAMKMMIQTKILCMEAEKDGVTLNEDELALVTTAVNKIMREQGEFVTVSGATKEEIRAFLEENALANKEYVKLTDGIDRTVDDDEVRRKRVTGLTIMPNTGTDEDGNTVSANTDEWKETVTKYADEVLERYYKELDGEAVAALYEGNSDVTVTALGALSMEKPEDYDDTTIDSYQELAWSLSTGEGKHLVMLNSADKYVAFVFYCLDDDDEEYKKEATEEILSTRRKEAFSEIYEDILKGYRKIHVYLDATNFSIDSTLYSGSEEYVSY